MTGAPPIKPGAPAPADEPTRRKRGAPPGNTNSLRHGFYSRRFRQVDLKDLEALRPGSGLESEIAALRVALRLLFESFSVSEAPDVPTAVSILLALGSTATRIAGLMRTNAILHGGQNSESSSALAQALEELKDEMPCLR
jgi:hypothetical protein